MLLFLMNDVYLLLDNLLWVKGWWLLFVVGLVCGILFLGNCLVIVIVFVLYVKVGGWNFMEFMSFEICYMGVVL